MQRSLHLSLSLSGVAALALANSALLPAVAQEGSADDLGVMEINLKDAINFNWGFQGALQGAGTPNQAGIGGFLPLSVGENSVFFFDALANVNFADRAGESSISNTDVAGTTISTSSRLGYRWLNNDRSWMYGLNAGYDSRPLASGNADTGVSVRDKRTVLFQQIAFNAEAVHESGLGLNAYTNIPVGNTFQRLNSNYNGGALDLYGLDASYYLRPNLKLKAGYYYQDTDCYVTESSSGGQVALEYEASDSLIFGLQASHDDIFETRVSGNVKYRFGTGNATTVEKKTWQTPVIQSLTGSIANRDIKVADGCYMQPGECRNLGQCGCPTFACNLFVCVPFCDDQAC